MGAFVRPLYPPAQIRPTPNAPGVEHRRLRKRLRALPLASHVPRRLAKWNEPEHIGLWTPARGRSDSDCFTAHHTRARGVSRHVTPAGRRAGDRLLYALTLA